MDQIGFVGANCGTNVRSPRHSRFTHCYVQHGYRGKRFSAPCSSRVIARPSFCMSTEEASPTASKRSAIARELRDLLKKCPIYFVGCMGCGKTAVAKYVAFELGYRFLDTDELIELTTSMSISDIFAENGEEQFRDLESAVLGQVQAFTASCIATGGGAVIRIANWGKMRTGVVVWLNAPPDVLAMRLDGDMSRPLLAGSDAVEDREARLADILNQRKTMYAQADVTVPIARDDAIDDIANEVMHRLANYIKENPPRFRERQQP